jgi:hypothetical protein
MELDHLKTIWKEVGTTTAGTSTEELEQMLSKKSKSPIAKLKRTLFIELVFVAVLYSSTILYYVIENKPGMLYLTGMLLLTAALYVWYYTAKRRLLIKMECVTCEVKSNLSTQLKTLEKYLKLYLWAGTLLVPVLLISSGVVVYFYNPAPANLPIGKNEFFPYFLAGMFIFSLIVMVPLYFLNKWYIHLLYGRHVKKLRAIVNEMNELPFQ